MNTKTNEHSLWKQSKFLTTGERINKLWYIHPMECNGAIKIIFLKLFNTKRKLSKYNLYI